MKWLIRHAWSCAVALSLFGVSFPLFADEPCDLGVHFGPVSFGDVSPFAAVGEVLAGTGVSLAESGNFGSAGTVTARDVSGTVGEAVRRLTEGTGLQYTCRNGVMRVTRKAGAVAVSSEAAAHPSAVTAAAAIPAVTPPPAVTGSAPAVMQPQPVDRPRLQLAVHRGDSLKARLAEFAQNNGYRLNWSGDDLFARQEALFTGSGFEDVVNQFLLAARVTGYLSSDGGRVLNVMVR